MLRRLLAAATVLGALASASPAWGDPPTVYDRDERGDMEPDHKFALMVNPLDAILGVYGGEADFVLLDHLAVSVGGGFYGINGSSAMALNSGVLVFPLTGALHGWYVDPQVVFIKPVGESPAHFDWHNDGAGFGVTSGWQWTWDYGFALRLGGGAMYYAGGGGDPQSAPIRGATPVLEGMIGWAF